jgi:hypothetical protein
MLRYGRETGLPNENLSGEATPHRCPSCFACPNFGAYEGSFTRLCKYDRFSSHIYLYLKFATNLYVLAQTTFGTERVETKLRSYANLFIVVANSLRAMFPLATSCLLVVAYVLQLFFDLLVWVGSYFQFNFTEVEGGVSCQGVLSLMVRLRR